MRFSFVYVRWKFARTRVSLRLVGTRSCSKVWQMKSPRARFNLNSSAFLPTCSIPNLCDHWLLLFTLSFGSKFPRFPRLRHIFTLKWENQQNKHKYRADTMRNFFCGRGTAAVRADRSQLAINDLWFVAKCKIEFYLRPMMTIRKHSMNLTRLPSLTSFF